MHILAGPMIFAPFSEVFGRRMIYASTLAVATIFVIPAALAPDIQTLLVARAIDGIALSAPMTLVGGTLADMWNKEERGIPMAAFSASPFMGPVVGPLTGGYLSMARGWRWLYWIQLILTGAAWLLIAFTVPETFAPTILARWAAKLRQENNGRTYITELEVTGKPLTQRLGAFLVRPFQLLFREPIVLVISIYMSILYGLMYMLFVSVSADGSSTDSNLDLMVQYPIVFETAKGYNAGTTGLMYIPIGVGVLCGSACAPLVNKHYLGLCKKHAGNPPAEARLIPMMLSCWFVPLGLFIFAWTSYPEYSWVGPALGGLPIGFGFIFLYNSANNYLGMSSSFQARRFDILNSSLLQLIHTNTKQRPPSLLRHSYVPSGVQ